MRISRTRPAAPPTEYYAPREHEEKLEIRVSGYGDGAFGLDVYGIIRDALKQAQKEIRAKIDKGAYIELISDPALNFTGKKRSRL